MKFNNFDVYPVGNAMLSLDERDGLVISNISDSGLDGVLINIENAPDAIVSYDTLQTIIDNGGVLKCKTLVKNSFNQVSTLIESFIWYNSELDQVIHGYNSSLLPQQYTIFGMLNGEEVFGIDGNNIVSPDPNFPGSNPGEPIPTFWVPVVVAIIAVAGVVFSAVYSKTVTTTVANYDANGRLTGYTVTRMEDPEPFEVLVNGEPYTVTDIGIRYEAELPEILVGKQSVDFHPVAIEITGASLDNFRIMSIDPNNS